jgi:hypothetical protein
MLDDATLKKMIREKLKIGAYRLTKHALDQQAARHIDLPDIIGVLKNGIHEKEKTILTSQQIWKYAIRGITEDSRTIRVIIAFDEDMIIITVINVKK